MIRSEEDFRRIATSRIAPIYFFDNKNKKVIDSATVTFFRKGDRIYAITNFHVYEKYLEVVKDQVGGF